MPLSQRQSAALEGLLELRIDLRQALLALLHSDWNLAVAADACLEHAYVIHVHRRPESSVCPSGCGRLASVRGRTCCRDCEGADGPHTRYCQQVQATRARLPASTPAADEGAAAPCPVVGEHNVDCPVCLDSFCAAALAVLPCGHRVCLCCQAALPGSGHTLCPMCRGPLAAAHTSSGAAGSSDDAPGYLVFGLPHHLEGRLGFYPGAWDLVDRELRQDARPINGRLGELGIRLRRVTSRAEATALWARHHRLPMPTRP